MNFERNAHCSTFLLSEVQHLTRFTARTSTSRFAKKNLNQFQPTSLNHRFQKIFPSSIFPKVIFHYFHQNFLNSFRFMRKFAKYVRHSHLEVQLAATVRQHFFHCSHHYRMSAEKNSILVTMNKINSK